MGALTFIWSVTLHSMSTSEQNKLNGGKASDWLRPYMPNWALSDFAGGVRLSSSDGWGCFKRFWFLAPSILEGKVRRSWLRSRRSCWCTTLSPRALKASALYYKIKRDQQLALNNWHLTIIIKFCWQLRVALGATNRLALLLTLYFYIENKYSKA